MPNNLTQCMKDVQTRTEIILQRMLPQPEPLPQGLHEVMRYAALDGGKRLRPMLVLAAAELGNPVQAACEAAVAATECIHVYSLVHDDMPEIDNDSLRRGKPTCHVRFGQSAALLAGDALQTLAFDVLSRETGLPAARQLAMINTLAQASGSLGMAGGQAIDLANVGRGMAQADLERMHSLKTGALIRASVRLGALCCPDLDDAVLAVLDGYASKLGLAFQVIDDVLDCEADTATLGKTAGKDADADKPTYVKLLGLEQARAYAERLAAEAADALSPFGGRAERLAALARFAVARSN